MSGMKFYTCLVTPSTTKIPGSIIDFLRKILKRCARVILNKVKELCCLNDSLFYPLIAAGVASVFCLETKGTNAEAPLR